MNNKNIALTGIRPTSRLHIGNYLGAVKGMLDLQNTNEFETYYMVADLHALTTPFNKATLQKSVKDVVIDYLACGLNPEKSTIFIQSTNPEHANLANLLSSVINVSKMLHLPTYKEKIKENPNNITMALLNYPVLMAADILAYKANYVPVGKDQEAHMEIARETARKLNSIYKTSFPEPKTYSTEGKYIPSLTGVGKMSKSIENSCIYLSDSLEIIKNKIAKIPTDSGKGESLPLEGGVNTLLTLVAHFISNSEKEKIEKDYLSSGIRYGDIKNTLSEKIFEFLQPIQQKRQEIENKNTYVKEVLEHGRIKATLKAKETTDEVKDCFGINYTNI